MGHYGVIAGSLRGSAGLCCAYMVCHGAVRGLTLGYPLLSVAVRARVRLPFVACRACWALPGCAGLSWAMPWLSGGYHKAICQSIMVRLWLALLSVVGHSWVACGTL